MVSNHIWFWCSKPESFFGAAFFGCQPAKPSETDPVQLPVVFWLLALRMLGSIEDFSRTVWRCDVAQKWIKPMSPNASLSMCQQSYTKATANQNQLHKAFSLHLAGSRNACLVYNTNPLNHALSLKFNDWNFEHVVRCLCISTFQSKQIIL